MDMQEKLSSVYYTAAEARQVLGLSEDAFHGYVRTGKVRKYMLPGKRQGRYLKKEIDALAASINGTISAIPGTIFKKAISVVLLVRWQFSGRLNQYCATG